MCTREENQLRADRLNRPVVDRTYMCTHEENQLHADRPNRPVVDRTYMCTREENQLHADRLNRPVVDRTYMCTREENQLHADRLNRPVVDRTYMCTREENQLRADRLNRPVVDRTYMCTREENQLRADRLNRPVVDRTYPVGTPPLDPVPAQLLLPWSYLGQPQTPSREASSWKPSFSMRNSLSSQVTGGKPCPVLDSCGNRAVIDRTYRGNGSGHLHSETVGALATPRSRARSTALLRLLTTAPLQAHAI